MMLMMSQLAMVKLAQALFGRRFRDLSKVDIEAHTYHTEARGWGRPAMAILNTDHGTECSEEDEEKKPAPPVSSTSIVNLSHHTEIVLR